MSLHIEACTVVRTYAGLSESFEVNVGLHQYRVHCYFLLSWMLSPVRREVVCLPSCCMPMTKYLWHQEWSSLADVWLNGELAFLTGLKVNTGKYKVMVGSSGGKMIVNSGKWCLVGKEWGQTRFMAQCVKN